MRQLLIQFLYASFFVLMAGGASADDPFRISFLNLREDPPPVLSNLDFIPDNIALAGAQLGLADTNATSKFMGRVFELSTYEKSPGSSEINLARQALAASNVVLIDAPADLLLEIADLPEAQNALIFNVAAQDVSLRDLDCRQNILHTIPSYAMRADALMQYVVFRRWDRLALVEGAHDKDARFASALRQSAHKFGLRFRQEKTWAYTADMRRNASQEVPLFTQDLGEYDLLFIADEIQDFGRYVAYNTWLPRPVAGSEGLESSAWAPVVEQWGAAQLQSRFDALADRHMRSTDYASWAAIRSVGEAVVRTQKTDIRAIQAYLLSDAFELAGFKGRPLTFRAWNGQLRQPMVLTTRSAMVAQAPLPGFLHQNNEMDSLGLDKPESDCNAFSN